MPLLASQIIKDNKNIWNDTLEAVVSCESDVNVRWASMLKNIAKPLAVDDKEQFIAERLIRMTAFDLKWSKAKTEDVLSFLTRLY